MLKIPYNILTISWDPTLAMDNPDFGDVQKRNIVYGKYVQNIYSVTYNKKALNLKDKKLSDNVYVYPTNSANQITFLREAYNIASQICQKRKIDLVLTQDPFLTGLVGQKLKKKFNIKFLVHFHGDFFYNDLWLKEDWFNRLLLLIGKRVVRQADGLRVMSQGIKQKLIKFGLKENIIRVIPTPVDLAKFGLYDKETNEIKDKKNILAIGRLVTAKDYPTLIEAIKILATKRHDFILNIIGGGPEFNNLKKITAQLDYVNLKGPIDHDQLPAEYKKADLLVLTSTNESFGKVLIEANACGKPVVSTSTTGAQEIIQEGYNGYLVPVGDAKAIADKLDYLLSNPAKAKELGEHGRQLVQERFNDNTVKIVQFWEDIITNKL